MKKGVIIGLLIVLLASMFVVSASFSKSSNHYDITTTYSPGSTLQGWIDIRLDNESINTILEDSEGNIMKLLQFLRTDTSLIEGVDYNCSIEV